MSGDSLFGGGTDLSQIVSGSSLDLINQFLTDTVGGTSTIQDVGGSTFVSGTGSDGEKQGALLPSGDIISGTIDDGVLTLDIQLPAGTGFVFEGTEAASADAVGDFLGSIVDSYLPAGDPATEGMRESLINAVNDLVNSIKALGTTNIVVRMIDFMSGTVPTASPMVGTNEVLFNVGASASQELFVINMNGLNHDQTLVLSGVENVMLAGGGNVRIQGDVGARVTSDGGNQSITGGGGNDTLIGGGGNDTLTGGAGDDTFGFVRLGHFTLGDFSGGDKIAFNVGGITNLSQLLPYLTHVTDAPQGVTYDFGPNFSLTLVGVSAADVTADMIKFTF